ncbi:hypothetical protein L0F63_002604 [Massospora cicadina]|nr:hypothetical protein L0F63_002604 [Massospora cicadina]
MDQPLLADWRIRGRARYSEALLNSLNINRMPPQAVERAMDDTVVRVGTDFSLPPPEAGEREGSLDPYGLVYAIFFLPEWPCSFHGMVIFITADEFFALKFRGSRYEATFSNFFSAVASTTNLVALVYALATQRKIAFRFRWFVVSEIYGRCLRWLVIMVGMAIVLAVYSQVRTFSPEANFWIAVGLLLIGTLSCSFLSSDVLALAATMNPFYVQGALLGRPLRAYWYHWLSCSWSARHEDALIQQGLVYFTSAFGVTLLSAVSFYYLQKHPLYGYARVELDPPCEEATKEASQSVGEQWVVVKGLVREQPAPVFHLFLTFAITLSVFPSLTASVRSVHPTGFVANHFSPLSFVVFNLGDLRVADRFASGVELLSFGRLALIPIFLLSNLDLGAGIPPAFPAWLASDAVYFLAMAALSVTNGYLGSVLMMSAPAQTRDLDHRGTMASVMSLTLTVGLTAGSLLSFAVKALACGCNPF